MSSFHQRLKYQQWLEEQAKPVTPEIPEEEVYDMPRIPSIPTTVEELDTEPVPLETTKVKTGKKVIVPTRAVKKTK